MGHGRHVLVGIIAAVAIAALADQGAPVTTVIAPAPVPGDVCTGEPERVQIASGASAIIYCCDGGVWVDCTPGGGGAAPANATYLVTTPSISLSAEVVVPSCAPGDALTYDGVSVTCFTPAGGGGGGAPTDATYLVMSANGGLSAEVVVPTCAAGDALTSNGIALSCFTPAGGGGGAVPTFVDNEIPTGTVNGSNTAFTLASAPSPTTSLRLYVNGVRLRPTTDYSISGTSLTMAYPPQVGDWFYADYRYGSSSLNFADGVVPSGTINGSNPTFTLAAAPTAGSLAVYLNGVRLRPTTDYSVSGTTLTMTMIPQTGDWFYVDYRF